MGLMKTPAFCLKLWGIWPLETFEKYQYQQLYRAYRFFIIGYYIVFNISQTVECIRLIIHREPFERISKCISVTVTLVLMVWKGLIYLRNKIPNMCLEVTATERILNACSDGETTILYKKMIKLNNYMNLWIIGSSIFTLMAFIFVSFIDLATTGPVFWEHNNVSFMHELYLPINRRKYYIFIIFFNIFTAVESVVLNAVIQTTFFGLTVYAVLQLKLLSIDLKNLHLKNYNPEKALKGIIKNHQDLIRFITALKSATKYVLLMSFILNSIKLAAVLIQIMSIRDISTLAFPIFYSFMLTSEVFFLGWMCNEVKEGSLAIADAAYNSLWYNENKNVKVMLKILMMRAQKPLTMDNGPFGPMTTNTIVSTLKAAYSYATLMYHQEE
ncbi:odorant receptor Or2-like isoform X1 [Anthonomus grandis grandis]|uniref:odorant receptor Or2-like isoform X1 n=1 Tax=Anthonomus grandis grandis TaxID=2921223 RepID=UPI002165D190|nr:odorant receptor Or2-like isoform X1 [Anthonomus grandis grandis]